MRMGRANVNTGSHSRPRGELGKMLREFMRQPMMNPDDVAVDIAAWQQKGDIAARNRVIQSHLRLVPKVARAYPGTYRHFADVVQEGVLGLMVAVDKYDPARGTRFVTYALLWIRAYVLPTLLRSQIVKAATRDYRRIFYNIGKAVREIEREGREATAHALAEHLKAPLEEVEFVLQGIERRELRLGTVPTDDDDAHPAFELPADASWRPDEQYERAEALNFVRSTIHALDAHLDERERVIFRLRTLADEPASLSIVADQFGLSRERIRQIERRMMEKLRNIYEQDERLRQLVHEAGA